MRLIYACLLLGILSLSSAIYSVGVLTITNPASKYTIGESPLILDTGMVVRYNTAINPLFTYTPTAQDDAAFALENVGTWPSGNIIVTIDPIPGDNFRDRLSCTPAAAGISSTYNISQKTLIVSANNTATIANIQNTLRTLKYYTEGMRGGTRTIRIWVLPRNYRFINSRNGRVFIMSRGTKSTPSGANDYSGLNWSTVAARVVNETDDLGFKALLCINYVPV